MRDVIIVGGGPGGLYAAARLAREGHDVAVLEEHRAIGQPVHCTGVLADEALAELHLPRGIVLNSLSTVRFHSPSGNHLSYTTPKTEALVIDRVAFDQQLADRAATEGAALMSGTKVAAIRITTDCAELDTGEGVTMRARAVVLACGASYVFQRRLGLGMPPVHLNSAQLEVPAGRSGDVELYFGSEIAPRGFAWVVPVARPGGHFVRIGLMCDGDPAGPFQRVVCRLGRSWGVAAEACGPPRRRLLPLAPIPRTYANRLLVIGDAAGLVKATTGGGIYYSIVSGDIAAEVLADALRRDTLAESALAIYQHRWRARLMPEFRAQLAMRMLAQRLTDTEIDALFELARTDGIMPIVRRTAEFNRHRNLIIALFKHPPARRVLFPAPDVTPVSLLDGVALRPDVAFRTIDDEGVVLDLSTGTYFGLNASGTRMWQLLAEHGSLQKVVAALSREFDATPDTLGRDLVAFVEHLASRDLVRVVAGRRVSRQRT